MAYMNYTPGAAGGSAMTVSPAGGGPGGPGGGGDPNAAFMQMLAMARADKLKRQREEEAMASREMLMREGQGRAQAGAELGRRQFAETQLRSSERGEAQRLALEGARTRSDLQGAAQQRDIAGARHKAMSGQAPKRILESRPGMTAGVALPAPHEYTGYQREIFGAGGSTFAPAHDSSVGDPGGQAWKEHKARQARQNEAARSGGASASRTGY